MRYPIHACNLHFLSAVRVVDKRWLEWYPRASVACRVARLTPGWHPSKQKCNALYDRICPSLLGKEWYGTAGWSTTFAAWVQPLLKNKDCIPLSVEPSQGIAAPLLLLLGMLFVSLGICSAGASVIWNLHQLCLDCMRSHHARRHALLLELAAPHPAAGF